MSNDLTIDFWMNNPNHTHGVMKMDADNTNKQTLEQLEERLLRENNWYTCTIWDEDLNVTKFVSKPNDLTKISVGDGVTGGCWTDRHPYEIIDIKSKCTIVVRSLRARRVDNNGMSDCQNYHYYRDFDGQVKTLRKVKGRWIEWGKGSTYTFTIGHARAYYDYSF